MSNRSSSPFEQELVKLAPELFRFARSLVGDPTVADDLVQETVARALQHRERFAEGTSLRAWTFTILRNFHYAQWHKQKRYSDWEPWLDDMLEAPAGQEGSAALGEIYDRICDLPDCQRNALLLVGIGGCTYEEAAELEACPVGTMKSRVSRARGALAAPPLSRPPRRPADSLSVLNRLSERFASMLEVHCAECAPGAGKEAKLSGLIVAKGISNRVRGVSETGASPDPSQSEWQRSLGSPALGDESWLRSS
jgi:RNA polymerase sigma factor (sigma-70 family)